MKPIFEQERLFLNKKLNLNLPKDCWRNGTKIYLDCTCKTPIYTFKVENNKIRITKDNSGLFKEYSQKSLNDLINLYEDKLNILSKKTIQFFWEYFFNPKLNHIKDDKFVLGHSTGKDSTVVSYMFCMFLLELYEVDKISYYDILNKTDINFANTSNDVAPTYKMAKNLINLLKEYVKDFEDNQLVIMNPKEGWSQWLERKNYFIPTVLTRMCCSVYKEGQINKFYDKNQNITHILGMRKYESTKRAKYDYIMDYNKCVEIFKTPNTPRNWTKICPIVEWHDEEVWLYILKNNLIINELYYLGFNRVGCILCPMQSDYIDLLIKEWFPKRWEWWEKILKKNYEATSVDKRLHWTFEEYKNGKWKAGQSKIQECITKKYTEERCLEVAKTLGISNEMASKYWNRTCECGKKLNPTELAMFYKLYGRFEGKNDTRIPKCKTCLCKDLNIDVKEYQKMYLNFREEGCNLF